MNNPKISIIVPIYNTEKYLSKCIESIQNQTYKNLEIILVNDGSTDHSLQICHKYALNDQRIIVIDKENRGISSARNSGLDIASGDYIGFVDSDDYISKDMYQYLLKASLKQNADIVECGFYRVDESYKIISSHPLKNKIIIGSYVCSKSYAQRKNASTVNWNKLYQKKIFDNTRFPVFNYSGDSWVNARAFYNCQKKITIEGCHYYYLKHKKSVTNIPFKVEKFDKIMAWKDIYEFYKENFKEFCPYSALRIAGNALSLYKNIKETVPEKKQKEYINVLITEFKNYYKLIDGEAYGSIKFTKKHFALLLFNTNPNLFYLVLKFYRKIRQKLNKMKIFSF